MTHNTNSLAGEADLTTMTSTYLLRQAEALLALSRATFDLALAGRLRALAEEFRAKAEELERSPIPGELAPARHSSQY
jgi:hypothetical protein